MKDTVIHWTKYRKSKNVDIWCGWYVVILKPKNYKECDDTGRGYEDWIAMYGFEKTWYHNGKFYIADFHGYGTEEVTDRVMYYSESPKIATKNSCKVEMQS